ncbi:MAG TPA: STAS domain-containing protein [Ramlibacter sp.]|jgi:phospholipid transport system transporter-binding protein|uniref:STAS domain-containing protein n=1 Tax=Ramlibacter sp. TaxID=1917967 RepID=UPI002D36DF8B|nr:STAS domain-containing protein [Ramlibacter sp.]HZY20109.1 STAS domain-containing protein [Ramlibacter sp.]
MLVLPAQLTHAQAPACARMLAQALRSQPAREAVADASPLQQFDSSALAVLLECRREAMANGKTFAVANMPPRLRELAAVYGVSELLAPAS